ncbi:MAG: D-alanine--D-alanine ligase [Patescibacteria group bacterium]|nr:D-alanine--D-alanine ligase [Patescibacteria group bacterium]
MKTIAVIFGGRSAEHDVSIITAHIPIIDSLLAIGEFDVWPVYITKEGKWYSDKKMNDLSYFKQTDYEERLARGKPVQLSFDGGLSLVWPGIFSKSVKVDVAFPAMHGTYGEDGSLQGVLRMAGVPFAGCDIFASAVAMDKVLTKQVVAAEGIPVVPYAWFTREQWANEQDEVREAISKLGYPVFVKPVHLGSSIGIAKAGDETRLLQAIEVALHYDEKVLVEKAVENLTEITLPLMGNEDVKPALPERPLNKTDFFNFDDKYLSGGKSAKGGRASVGKGGVNNAYSEVPANIGEEMTKRVIDLGTRVYRALGCEGTARVDFLIDSVSDTIYVNEVNTLPGSLYHHNWRKAGVSNIELVTKLVRLAEERFASQKTTTFAFASDILQKVGGPKTQK